MDRTRPPQGEFPPIRAVILAAGRSVRMGRVKALLPWPPRDLPCVIHVIERLREGGAGDVAVVTGAHHEAIQAAVGDRAAVLFNPRHDAGQLASLQVGLTWGFAGASDWTLVTLVDLPGVSARTVAALLHATTTTAALAVRPAIGGRHGHPVLWRRDAWPRLQGAGPGGARQVMREAAAAGRVLDLEVEDDAVLRDIDTPDDYRALLGHRPAGDGPPR